MSRRSPYPLFNPKLLGKHIGAFGFPGDLDFRAQKIQRWQIYYQLGEPISEVTKAEFIHDLFVEVLGYGSPFLNEDGGWELEFEPQLALGFFDSDRHHPIIEIIWKEERSVLNLGLNPSTNSGTRNKTVEWLITLDYQDICLYRLAKGSLAYETFSFSTLLHPDYLKAFYFIFGRRTLLKGNFKSQSQSRVAILLDESESYEREAAQDFYTLYQKIRFQLVKDFRYRLHQANWKQQSESEWHQLAIAQAQKLLNRILFISFCEAQQILPEGMLRQAYEFHNPYIYQPAWENYKAVFGWLRTGNSDWHPAVPAFAISLFAVDSLLDEFLFVGEELCRQIKELTRFSLADDLSPGAIADILEEAVKDLKQLRKLASSSEKRKKVRFLEKSGDEREQSYQNLRTWLQARLTQVESSDPAKDPAKNETENWSDRLSVLKILDGKCLAGTALADAFQIMLSECQNLELPADANLSLVELATAILQHNLYGCDSDFEAIAIAKLQLWLRILTLVPDAILTEGNLKMGKANECFPQFAEAKTNPVFLLKYR